MGDGRMSRNLTSACWLTMITLVIMIIAFSTPCWLENNGMKPNPKFIRLGLWEVCLEGFEDLYFRYDKAFFGCRWVFDEEFHFINDILLRPFFTATQVFFTFSFAIGLLACVLVLLYNFVCPPDMEILALTIIGGGLMLAGFFGTIAVIVFGALGDSRDWMPHWESNNLSWSFAFGVIGVIGQAATGILFLVEARRFRKRRETNAGGSDARSTAFPLK